MTLAQVTINEWKKLLGDFLIIFTLDIENARNTTRTAEVIFVNLKKRAEKFTEQYARAKVSIY